MTENSENLDQQCLTYTTGIPVNPNEAGLCRLITCLLSTTGRIQREKVHTVARYRSHIFRQDKTVANSTNWETIATYSTFWTFVKSVRLPKKTEDIKPWTGHQLHILSENYWTDSNNLRYIIAPVLLLTTAYSPAFTQNIEEMITKWYLNQISCP